MKERTEKTMVKKMGRMQKERTEKKSNYDKRSQKMKNEVI